MQLSKLLSNSQQVSLDNPGKVIGHELCVQKVVHESRFLIARLEGRATLYDSMASSFIEPMEMPSIASTSGAHVSCMPRLLFSCTLPNQTDSSDISLVTDPGHSDEMRGINGQICTPRQVVDTPAT